MINWKDNTTFGMFLADNRLLISNKERQRYVKYFERIQSKIERYVELETQEKNLYSGQFAKYYERRKKDYIELMYLYSYLVVSAILDDKFEVKKA